MRSTTRAETTATVGRGTSSTTKTMTMRGFVSSDAVDAFDRWTRDGTRTTRRDEDARVGDEFGERERAECAVVHRV